MSGVYYISSFTFTIPLPQYPSTILLETSYYRAFNHRLISSACERTCATTHCHLGYSVPTNALPAQLIACLYGVSLYRSDKTLIWKSLGDALVLRSTIQTSKLIPHYLCTRFILRWLKLACCIVTPYSARTPTSVSVYKACHSASSIRRDSSFSPHLALYSYVRHNVKSNASGVALLVSYLFKQTIRSRAWLTVEKRTWIESSQSVNMMHVR